jgi:hypothetical protein
MWLSTKHRLLTSLFLVFSIFTSARAFDLQDAENQVRPLQVLTRPSVQIGIGVAVALNPSTAGLKKAVDVTKLLLDESIAATEFRNSVVQEHLIVVSKETEKLEEIKQRDGNLKSDEARAIIDDLKRGHFANESTEMFLAKSVFSARMVYGVASRYYTDKFIEHLFGESIAKRLPLGNRAETFWLRKTGVVRTYTNIPWNHLTVLGRNSRLLTDSLKVVLLKKIGKAIGSYTLQNSLDRIVEDILRDHPSIPEAAVSLRLNLMTQPQLLRQPELLMPMPALRPVAPALVPAPPTAFRAPPIMIQRDPVVSAAAVQQQVIHYQIEYGGSQSVRVEPEVREPVEHPTHSSSLPSSISIGGSFTGGSGSTLFTRY